MNDESASRLLAYLDKARARHKPGPEAAPPPRLFDADPVAAELVRSFLFWEVGSPSAARALESITSHAIDLNELRVFLPDEIAAMLPAGDPRAQERAERLRACLNDIYMREHDVRLASLLEEGKRDTRAYLDSLDGMHPFVSARVYLLCLGGHAFPIDTRLRDLLVRARVAPADQSPTDLASWLERHVRAGEAAPIYAALEALAEQQAARPPSTRAAARAKSATGAPKRAAATRPRKTSESRTRSKKTSSEN